MKYIRKQPDSWLYEFHQALLFIIVLVILMAFGGRG